MTTKLLLLFQTVKSLFKKSYKSIILAVLALSLIVVCGEKSPLLANQSGADKAKDLIEDGRYFLENGEPEAALEMWKEAEDIYHQFNLDKGVIGSKLNQGLALEAMGFYRRSCALVLNAFSELNFDKCEELDLNNIDEVIDTIRLSYDSLNWRALEGLGNRLRLLGKLKASERVLERSLLLNNSPEVRSKLLLALGNTKQKLGKKEEALNLYDRAANLDNAFLETRLQALLNKSSLLVQKKDWKNAELLLANLRPVVANLPANLFAIEAKIYLASNLFCVEQQNPNCLIQEKEIEVKRSPYLETKNLLEQALAETETIADKRSRSLALGKLGLLSERIGAEKAAKDYTEKALNLAQSIQASEQAYQWQWQLGRLLEKEGNLEGAIAAYSASVNTLQTLRGNLSILNRDLQFNFRERIEPIYRKLVTLLLKNPVPENLVSAQNVIELLQLAELDNYFQEACARINDINLSEIDTNAAVISTIFLPDRSQPQTLELILSLPNDSPYHYSVSLKELRFNNYLQALTKSFERKPNQNANILRKNNLSELQYMYEGLIKPVEEILEANNTKTLVFVLDSLLQNLPMAALYDGEKYLIEKYAIALTPGLQLLPPRKLETGQIKALAVGRSDFANGIPLKGWNDLDSVKDELDEIADILPTKKLLNKGFTSTNLRGKIVSLDFPLVHIATHGKFDSTSESTFIIAWNETISIDRLGRILNVSDPTRLRDVELLVLSACQTALGNERTALGMAGAALRVGARTTLASLWNVNDRSTAKLMAQFYQELETSADASNRVNKAEALRQAQISLLRGEDNFQNPHFWAPFVLVGHWL